MNYKDKLLKIRVLEPTEKILAAAKEKRYHRRVYSSHRSTPLIKIVIFLESHSLYRNGKKYNLADHN